VFRPTGDRQSVESQDMMLGSEAQDNENRPLHVGHASAMRSLAYKSYDIQDELRVPGLEREGYLK
jgi:hypothetical protein